MSRKILLPLLSLFAWGAAAHADRDHPYPLLPAYVEECGSCHTAFPAPLLPAASWVAVMAGLRQHFGTDASLEPARADEIGRWLAANAGRDDARGAGGKPHLRLTETRWFQREHRDGHDGLSAAVWTSETVKTPANCSACHRNADTGDYSERTLRIPR